ncbi:winged helix-turn-helix domain-containing protein [Sinobaca sp. H24]|uniref:winged helix-turn-helix domain-containing protein n=1 Tax=Sinobaca sp. H24 TaxID=2923376 RepID=UPI00207A1351|nr:winged helix-turn-helix domain-containing protein [Sinobaca sp. H24]
MKRYKVAVIAPNDIIADCMEVTETFPLLELLPYTYKKEAEIPEVVQSVDKSAAAVLFGGLVPFHKIKERMSLTDKPAFFLPFTGAGLFKALYSLKNVNINNISMDTMNKKPILETLMEIGMEEAPAHLLEFESSMSVSSIISFHKELFEQGETEYVLTSLAECYEALTQMNVPVKRIKPPKSVIRETLEKIESSCEREPMATFQAAACSISLKGYSEWAVNQHAIAVKEYELELEKLMSASADKVKGCHVQRSPEEIILITTLSHTKKKEFIREIDALKTKIEALIPIPIHIGVGFSLTLQEAVLEARETAGTPFIKEFSYVKQIKRKPIQADFRELADKVGISILTLNKVYELSKTYEGKFTANQLAEGIGITVKSAQRILRQLEKADLVDVTGKESHNTKGKHRRVYSLSKQFDTYS